VYDELLPHAERCVGLGASLCMGSTHLPLGIAAATAGHASFEEHFAAALDMHERIGARPLAAETRFRWGSALLDRGDVTGALPMLRLAGEEADALGMVELARRCQSAAADGDRNT
jgi:hypothetical protein